ncbi:MAG: TetR/AcrR family transcriptional regulator [Christensenellales bacterium]|jgi:AcrR family transcriptional regulator
MKRMTKEETNARIRQAALSCLREGGPVTMEEVARRADISRRTLYRYYGSREKLLESLRGSWLEDCRRELNALRPLDAYRVGLAVFRTITAYLPEIRAYRESGRLPVLFRMVQEEMSGLERTYCPEKMEGKPEHYLRFDGIYHSAGFIALLNAWLSEEPERTPEEMAEIYAAIMDRC